jgi:hypothetical protein
MSSCECDDAIHPLASCFWSWSVVICCWLSGHQNACRSENGYTRSLLTVCTKSAADLVVELRTQCSGDVRHVVRKAVGVTNCRACVT